MYFAELLIYNRNYMNLEDLHHSLNSDLSSNKKRHDLIAYLKTCVDTLPSDEDERRATAYDMAGL